MQDSLAHDLHELEGREYWATEVAPLLSNRVTDEVALGSIPEMRPKMVSVEFRNVAPGTCSWCGKEKSAVFTVVFSDRSFDGPIDLCPNDFGCAMKIKVRGSSKSPAPNPATPAGSSA